MLGKCRDLLSLPRRMATKIKDGVFVGDAEAAQDVDFLEANKVLSLR